MGKRSTFLPDFSRSSPSPPRFRNKRVQDSLCFCEWIFFLLPFWSCWRHCKKPKVYVKNITIRWRNQGGKVFPPHEQTKLFVSLRFTSNHKLGQSKLESFKLKERISVSPNRNSVPIGTKHKDLLVCLSVSAIGKMCVSASGNLPPPNSSSSRIQWNNWNWSSNSNSIRGSRIRTKTLSQDHWNSCYQIESGKWPKKQF